MYVQFFFYYGLQSLGHKQQLNRVQLYKSTNSTMQDSTYTTQHQLRRGINPQHIPICQQVRDMSIVQHAYVRALPVVYIAYVHGLSVLQPAYAL
jgi:hypothetical protein